MTLSAVGHRKGSAFHTQFGRIAFDGNAVAGFSLRGIHRHGHRRAAADLQIAEVAVVVGILLWNADAAGRARHFQHTGAANGGLAGLHGRGPTDGQLVAAAEIQSKARFEGAADAIGRARYGNGPIHYQRLSSRQIQAHGGAVHAQRCRGRASGEGHGFRHGVKGHAAAAAVFVGVIAAVSDAPEVKAAVIVALVIVFQRLALGAEPDIVHFVGAVFAFMGEAHIAGRTVPGGQDHLLSCGRLHIQGSRLAVIGKQMQTLHIVAHGGHLAAADGHGGLVIDVDAVPCVAFGIHGAAGNGHLLAAGNAVGTVGIERAAGNFETADRNAVPVAGGGVGAAIGVHRTAGQKKLRGRDAVAVGAAGRDGAAADLQRAVGLNAAPCALHAHAAAAVNGQAGGLDAAVLGAGDRQIAAAGKTQRDRALRADAVSAHRHHTADRKRRPVGQGDGAADGHGLGARAAAEGQGQGIVIPDRFGTAARRGGVGAVRGDGAQIQAAVVVVSGRAVLRRFFQRFLHGFFHRFFRRLLRGFFDRLFRGFFRFRDGFFRLSRAFLRRHRAHRDQRKDLLRRQGRTRLRQSFLRPDFFRRSHRRAGQEAHRQTQDDKQGQDAFFHSANSFIC